MIYCLYGQPGTGKTTLATGMCLDYLRAGRRVVANFAIDAAPASVRPSGPLAEAHVHVLPSRPTFDQLAAIGRGWKRDEDIGREDIAGLLLIDEAGPWLDSRKWNAADRAQIIDWLLHSRKRGWDVILIAQAPALIDKQVREAVVEGYARCRRLDRLKMVGVKMPRMHIAVARYGLDANAPVIERWFYRGRLEHKCFNSYALFDTEAEHGPYCTLPPRLTKWRGLQPGFVAWFRRLAGLQDRAARARASGPARPAAVARSAPVLHLLRALPSDLRVAEYNRLQRLGYV